MINVITHLQSLILRILTIVRERGDGGERGDEELLHGVGVGGGQQVGGQHRARDGAGAGHHHLGHCGMWYLLALLSSSMLHNSQLIHPSLDPHPCVSVSNCVACLNLHPPPPGSWR